MLRSTKCDHNNIIILKMFYITFRFYIQITCIFISKLIIYFQVAIIILKTYINF